MNLLQLRTQFVKRNGRYDLVDDTVAWNDNGANYYINAGQRYLDRFETIKKSQARNYQYVTADDYYVTFPYCRAVQGVYVMDSDAQKKLEKVDYDKLREYYAKPQSDLDTGEPTYYVPIGIRLSEEIDRMEAGEITTVTDWAHVVVDPSYEYNAIMFYPPADASYTIEITGLFSSPELSSDTDTSYFAMVHPEILLMAANRQLEIDYRNTAGVKDWEAAIQSEVFGLGKDLVEEHIAEVNQMEG